jgi:NAD(P)-dependent dehydrogenase (short-subunit alcohol dehydrogenase family)
MTTYLITGVHRGIGFELAKQAIANGDRVYGSVRHQKHADAIAVQLGTGFTPLIFDVTDSAGIQEAAESLDVTIDILINNAGIIGPSKQSTLAMDFDGFAETLAINTLAPLVVTQAFLPQLRRSKNPRIMTISSKMGSMAHQTSDRIAYRASKAAVNKVMQGLATDLSAEGITVISMHPGWVRTDMGGGSADIGVEESAAGILQVSRALNIENSGTFINYDGSKLAW